MFFESDMERFARTLLDNRIFAGRLLGDLFVELEGYLIQWLAPEGHKVGVAPGRPASTDAEGQQQVTLRMTSLGFG